MNVGERMRRDADAPANAYSTTITQDERADIRRTEKDEKVWLGVRRIRGEWWTIRVGL